MQQGSPEWHEWRQGKIGGSDAPVIMGDSPWCNPHTLWQRKLGLLPEQKTSYAMLRGIEMEEKARQAFEEQTGFVVFPDVRTHPKLPWMIASLDGITMQGDVIVEIKCPTPGGSSHKSALEGVIPAIYKAQLQHQMLVCGLDEVFYWSYDGERGILLREIADTEYQRELLRKEVEFFECMRTSTSPADDRDVRDAEWTSCAEQLREALLSQRRIDSDVNNLKERLVGLSEGKGHRLEGAGVSVTFVRRRGAVDYSCIPSLRNIDLEPYRGPDTEYWSVKLKDL